MLPRLGELSPEVLRRGVARLRGEAVAEPDALPPQPVFPRPPTMCVACPHLGIYYTLSQLRNIIISGDIGCYTLGAGHPWNALDTCISMGASMGMALGLDKGRSDAAETRWVTSNNVRFFAFADTEMSMQQDHTRNSSGSYSVVGRASGDKTTGSRRLSQGMPISVIHGKSAPSSLR